MTEDTQEARQNRDSQTCFGTGNETWMRAIQPGRKILFQPCPECGGSGKVQGKGT